MGTRRTLPRTSGKRQHPRRRLGLAACWWVGRARSTKSGRWRGCSGQRRARWNCSIRMGRGATRSRLAFVSRISREEGLCAPLIPDPWPMTGVGLLGTVESRLRSPGLGAGGGGGKLDLGVGRGERI